MLPHHNQSWSYTKLLREAWLAGIYGLYSKRGCEDILWQVNEVDRLMEIIRQAAQERALVFYTLADPHMTEAAQKACEVCFLIKLIFD